MMENSSNRMSPSKICAATGKKDEIGLMAKAVLIFKENMIKAKELAAREAEAVMAREARARRVDALTVELNTGRPSARVLIGLIGLMFVTTGRSLPLAYMPEIDTVKSRPTARST